MRKAYKFRLYPTKEQQERIQFTLERCRLLYNRLLDERRSVYETDKTTLNYYDLANTFVGYVQDRDINAAQNILKRALAV